MRTTIVLMLGIVLALFSTIPVSAKIVMVNDPIDMYPEFTNYSPEQLSDPSQDTKQIIAFFLVDLTDQRRFYPLIKKSM